MIYVEEFPMMTMLRILISMSSNDTVYSVSWLQESRGEIEMDTVHAVYCAVLFIQIPDTVSMHQLNGHEIQLK